MVVVCTVFGVGAQDLVPPMEYSKFLKSAEMVGPLKDGLFGDQVSMYNGQTEFVVTDASLQGNSALPVSLSRRFSVVAQTSPTAYRGFGIWDVEVPHLSGTFATGSRKWNIGYNGVTNRCSQWRRRLGRSGQIRGRLVMAMTLTARWPAFTTPVAMM
ncbi:MAG TPA: hypothetical protein DCM50_10390 [Stenotrophomonas sp.]|nr:hypothetical protein [Stenotrophomonas sp.]